MTEDPTCQGWVSSPPSCKDDDGTPRAPAAHISAQQAQLRCREEELALQQACLLQVPIQRAGNREHTTAGPMARPSPRRLRCSRTTSTSRTSSSRDVHLLRRSIVAIAKPLLLAIHVGALVEEQGHHGGKSDGEEGEGHQGSTGAPGHGKVGTVTNLPVRSYISSPVRGGLGRKMDGPAIAAARAPMEEQGVVCGSFNSEEWEGHWGRVGMAGHEEAAHTFYRWCAGVAVRWPTSSSPSIGGV